MPLSFTPNASFALRERVIKEHPGRVHDFRFLRKTVLTEMATTVGYQPDFVGDAFAVFDAARNNVELFPDVMPVLMELSTHFRVIALTNGNANLETIGIRECFHSVVTAVDAGRNIGSMFLPISLYKTSSIDWILPEYPRNINRQFNDFH